MGKNKIILFYPKPERYGNNLIPLNLLAIARMLDPQLYEMKIINATVEKNYAYRIMEELKRGNVLCLGITAMTGYQIYDALKIAKITKGLLPNLPIIWGGYHPSILPLETIAEPTVDIVVKGQGEITFKELVERLSNKQSLDDIQGIAYKNEKGELKENPDRPFQDLNKFPPLPWDLVDISMYTKRDPKWDPTIDYYTAQGCPFNCGFCAEPMFSKRKWTGLTAERVVEEIQLLISKYKIKTIIIRDSNFFVNRERVIKICEQIISRNFYINFVGVNARIDTLLSYEDEIWKLLYRAGFRELLVGAESGAQKVLDLINKKVKVEDTFRFFEKASRYNFKIWVSLMTGLPGLNNKEEFEATLDLLDSMLMKNYRCVSNSYIFHYTPYPGSYLYEISKQYGFKPPSSPKGWSKLSLYNVKSPWVPKKYRRWTNYLSLYILRRLINPFQPTNPIINLIYKKFIDPVFKWRWRKRYFDFFFEKYVIEVLNYLGRLKKRLKRK